MKMIVLKKTLIGVASVFTLLVLLLIAHIYIVTRPKVPDANTRIMARIDIDQPISQAEANNITSWLYQQKGIDHVLCNPVNHNIVFTFFPVKTTANLVVQDFKSNYNIMAHRHEPSKLELSTSCPVVSTSQGYKVYSFLKKIF